MGKQLVAQLVQINLFVMFMVASFGWSADSFARQEGERFFTRCSEVAAFGCTKFGASFIFMSHEQASKHVGKLTN